MTTIPLKLLFDLQERVREALPCRADWPLAERAALDWAEANGLLTGFAWFEYFRQATELPLREVNRTGPHGRKETVEIEIPTGPHAAPEAEAGAPGPATDGAEGPEHGAEGVDDRPEPAPVPPVAGDGTPILLAPEWSAKEDRFIQDMKAAGHTAKEIAEALGRTVAAVHTRWNKVLKPQPAAKAEVAIAERAEDAPPAGEPRAEIEKDSETAAPKGAATEGGAETGGDCSGPIRGESPRQEGSGAPGASSPSAAAAPAPARSVGAALHAELNALGYKRPWTPALDLQLVSDMTLARPLAEVAADLGFDTRVVKDRWNALRSIGAGQREAFLDVLRDRADPSSAKAAE